MTTNWQERPFSEEKFASLCALGLSELQARILAARGIGADGLDAFLSPSIQNLAAPQSLPGIVRAADVVLEYIAAKRKIVIFGDYDCDGVCATAIMTRCIEALGGIAAPFLPDRMSEGYGMTDASVARMLSEIPDAGLVVTVDNGINSVTQVEALKAKGIAVVITDHHLPGEELPIADALVNPKVDSPEELGGLCGAAVAFMLANQMVSVARKSGSYSGPSIGGAMLVLAGLATVTDIMPLTGQNRILVAESLRRFQSWAPIGLKELLDRAARTARQTMTSKDYGFLLGPRINAAGRVASGMEALELLSATDREIARECARIVDERNLERKAEESKAVEDAWSKIVPGASAQVIDLPDAHPGVAGIVAARILDRLGKDAQSFSGPVCVIARGHGSARSPELINIRDAMDACKDVLERFGGHAAAGGFKVKSGMVDEFRTRLCRYCSEMLSAAAEGDGEDRVCLATHKIDAWVTPADMTFEFADWLTKLEPFGEGNCEPLFAMRDVEFSDIKLLGIDGRHLQFCFKQQSMPRAIWWGAGDKIEEFRSGLNRRWNLLFRLFSSDYGKPHAELSLISIERADSNDTMKGA